MDTTSGPSKNDVGRICNIHLSIKIHKGNPWQKNQESTSNKSLFVLNQARNPFKSQTKIGCIKLYSNLKIR